MDIKEVIADIFYQNKNPDIAHPMAAYMKHRFPFLGIKKPVRALLQKPFLTEFKQKRELDWDLVFQLWELPEREFQYLALDILVALKKQLVFEDLEKLQKLIVRKSWWDTVDTLATHCLGQMMDPNNKIQRKAMLQWSKSSNIWIARSAILFQLKYKNQTDRELLQKILQNNLCSREFFINKAIGWILREYSKTNKEWVIGFLEKNNLHALSRREASKYL